MLTRDDPLAIGDYMNRELLTTKAAPDATHAAGRAAGGTDDEDAGGDEEEGGESTAPADGGADGAGVLPAPATLRAPSGAAGGIPPGEDQVHHLSNNIQKNTVGDPLAIGAYMNGTTDHGRIGCNARSRRSSWRHGRRRG